MATPAKRKAAKKKRGEPPASVGELAVPTLETIAARAIAGARRTPPPEPKYDCALCSDTGWIPSPTDSLRATECACRAKRLRAARFGRVGIPKRYVNCTIDGFFDRGVGELVAAKRRMQEFADCWPGAWSIRPGALMGGGPGTGKTHLAIATLRAIVEVDKPGELVFVNFNDFVERVKSTFRDDADVRTHDVTGRVINADLLVLDELGGVRPTEWVADLLYTIINDRYNEERTTIFTTNYADDPAPGRESLTDRIGNRLRSRLSEMCEYVSFRNVPDFRSSR